MTIAWPSEAWHSAVSLKEEAKANAQHESQIDPLGGVARWGAMWGGTA